ncbi:5-carboxymethyl-2-hydroxymuconate Delta-isomerase [Kordiimonas lipolytica]|uniref:5-carboxymethyl-2-hydroxymuconate Delta-isomerase n=1 Tax=Kordiimonas lipolytica TaxID=1662421 RepID=A0ABV8UAL6_9PROT|nr:5-carboxymethyl-2-hydroxymuconate Delta-isomerase [Kordiimonas lipolytica]
MPHLIVEYSRDLEDEAGPDSLLAAAHDISMASGLFDESDIKVRLFPVDHALVAGKPAPTLHITCYLLSGRDQPTKKALNEALINGFAALVPSAKSISANAIDMDRESYAKISR